MSEPAFIAVEGPIGVGKTALAKRLADRLNAGLVLESQAANPFLERFYRDRSGSALPAQLFFLFERTRQVENLRQDDLFSALRIADFLLERDRLFAELNLDSEELQLYEQIRARLAIDPPQPDLVVYLQAPVDVLAERINRRGRDYERQLDRDYLERVAARYARFFHDYDDAPLLIVNAASIDPIHNDVDFEALLERVTTIRRGRHFYNPIAAFG